MTDVALDGTALQRWRADPLSFVEEVLHDPETGKPFVLLEAERAFMRRAFVLDPNGRLAYPELVYGAPKKSGKTTLAALIVLVMVLLRSDGRFAEGYCVANDLEQAQSRVFTVIRRIVEASPLLCDEARITADRISFLALDASIIALASDAASAAGGNPTISCFDELWGYVSERSRRLWDEMITSPARKISCRLTVSYAGFSGESVLLEELYKRGAALPEIGPSLRAGDGMLFAWHTTPVAPWQDERWLAEMRRSLRPSAYARMITNEFVSSESRFVDLAAWDACVQPSLTPVVQDKSLPVWVGVDASTKRDSTALVAVAYDQDAKCVRSVAHKIFTPTPGDPIDFEATIERTLREWYERFRLQHVLFDPYQMAAVSQRLAQDGIPIEEYPMTVPNLTAATSNLFDLISARQLVLYPDAAMRLAISHAIIVESARGWRLDKLKQSHKIDVVVALSLAALAAVRVGGQPGYDVSMNWVFGDDDGRLIPPAVSGSIRGGSRVGKAL
jgi:phage terminase large subunit-like protein